MSEHPHDEYAAEAEARWGDTEAWRQSKARTAGYSKDDWSAVKEEQEAIERDFATALRNGVHPEDDAATAIAERARLQIDRRFYACSHAMHEQLAAMYTADARFRAHYEGRQEGLAEYVAAAIRANARKHEAGARADG